MDASGSGWGRVLGESNRTLLWQGLHHLVWPAQCLSCGERCAASDRWLCQACWADLLFCTGGTSCPRCARDASPFALVDGACPGCLGRESVLSGIARCGVYQAVLRDLILAFKNGRT